MRSADAGSELAFTEADDVLRFANGGDGPTFADADEPSLADGRNELTFARCDEAATGLLVTILTNAGGGEGPREESGEGPMSSDEGHSRLGATCDSFTADAPRDCNATAGNAFN